MPTLQTLKAHLTSLTGKRDRELKVFQDKLAKDPVNAFEWADGVMQSTAIGRIADHYLDSIVAWEAARDADKLDEKQPQTEDDAVEFIRASVNRMALNKARYVKRSTSVCSNFMDAETAAAYADLASDWNMLCG